MYNNQLDAFIMAAELGSFSKAAKALYITPSSLIQQINILEKRIDVLLFERSSKGVTLTPAGISLFEDAKNIVRMSKMSIERAQSIQSDRESIIRVATSFFTKCRYVTDIWNQAIVQNPKLKIELIPQTALKELTKNPLENLGVNFDLQEGVYLSGLYKNNGNFFQLSSAKMCIGVPSQHRLYSNEIINFSDLENETIILSRQGNSESFDKVRNLLIENVPTINLIDVDYYDIDIFTTCEINNFLLLSLDVWEDIYPTVKTINLNVDITIPYGIIYSLDLNNEVSTLISTAQAMKKNGFFLNR
ncbi:LysR family transcriptional regulator [Enterococcus sp. LJL120]